MRLIIRSLGPAMAAEASGVDPGGTALEARRLLHRIILSDDSAA